MIAVGIFIANSTHLVDDLSLRRSRSKRNLVGNFWLGWWIVNILSCRCEILTCQKQHLLVKVTNHWDFLWSIFDWFMHEFFLLNFLMLPLLLRYVHVGLRRWFDDIGVIRLRAVVLVAIEKHTAWKLLGFWLDTATDCFALSSYH